MVASFAVGSLVALVCRPAAAVPAAVADPEPGGPAAAAVHLAVGGWVKAADGAPRAGARVELLPVLAHRAVAAPAPVAATVTGEAGRFALEAPAAGVWAVEVQAPGCGPMRFSPLPLTGPVELPPVVLGAERVADASSSDGPATLGWRPPEAEAASGGEDGSGDTPQPAGGVGRSSDGEAPAADRPPAVAHGRLQGRVVSAVDGRPLAGVVVWASHDPGAFTFTDSRGRYRLELAAGVSSWVQAHGAGLLPRGAWARGGEGHPPRAPTLALAPAATLRGRVSDAAGQPLAGVLLAAWPALAPASPAPFSRDPAAARGVSDGRGAFALPGLDPNQAYEVAALAPGFLPVQAEVASPAVAAGLGGLRLSMVRARPASGRVMDTARRPVAGARVEVRPFAATQLGRTAESGVPPAEPVTALTGEEGRFELPAMPAPRMNVEVRRSGYAPLTVRGVEAPAGEGKVDLGTFVMPPGAVLAGRVTAAEGGPLGEVEVWAVPAAGRPDRRLAAEARRREPDAVSGSEGRFTVGDRRPGERVHLLFARHGFLSAWLQGIEAPRPGEPAPQLTAVLEPAFALRGRVVDEARQPVAGARVLLRGLGPAAGGLEAATTSGPRGGFGFEELPPGEVEVEARHEDYQPSAPSSVEVPGKAAAGVRLVLRRGAVVEGWVADPEGQPIARVELRIEGARATSDGEGRFRLRGVPPGRRLLEARHPDFRYLYRWLEVEPGLPALDLVLAGGWPVAGVVMDGETGAAVAGVEVELRHAVVGAARRYRVLSGPNGRFRFPSVAPGTYALAARRSGFADSGAATKVRVAGEAVEDLELLLRPGATVGGRILGVESDELASVRVEAVADGGPGRPGTVDYRGSYEIRDLGPGDWLLRAALPGGSRQAEARIVVGEETRQLTRDLELGGGLTLAGRVTLDGEPASGIQVSLSGYDVAGSRTVWADHLGRFHLEDLEAGRYRVDLSEHRLGLLDNRDVELSEDRELAIDVATARVAGRVVSADSGRPLAGARVSLQRLPEGPGGRPGSITALATDADGSFAVAKLTAGRFRLTVSDDGYSPVEEALDLAPGAAVEGLEIRLEPTAGLDLLVRQSGDPRETMVTLVVLAPAGGVVLAETRRLPQDGRVRFPTVPPGSWQVLLTAPEAAPARAAVTVPGPPVEVQLPPGSRLAVRVPALATSSEVATLAIASPAGQPFVGMDLTGALHDRWPLTAGAGVVEGVPPGTWALRATALDGRTWERQVTTAGGDVAVALE